MTRNSHNNRVLSYTDCCERTYLLLLALEVMSKYPRTNEFVRRYARKTASHDSYKYFRSTSTDLYNFIYFVVGDDDAMAKLKDSESAKAMRSKTTLPLMAVNRHITKLSTGQTTTNLSEFLMQLETALNITNSDYKSIRRSIVNYNTITSKERSQAVTRLLFAVRAKLRSSDIIEEFERLAAIRDLEIAGVTDNEPTVSVPDVSSVSGRELALYRLLVGDKNLVLAKNFVERAKQGLSTSGPMNQSYLPVIKMIDDIVKGGPSYIQLLRSLHKRAKRDEK